MKRITDDECNQALDELKRAFPYQFREGKTSIELSFGGWLRLFGELCARVDRELPEARRKAFWWTQVKEKFGGLRCYFEGGPTWMDIQGLGTFIKYLGDSNPDELTMKVQELVLEAEERSWKTCQWCGEAGERQQRGGYIYTGCASCMSDRAIWGQR